MIPERKTKRARSFAGLRRVFTLLALLLNSSVWVVPTAQAEPLVQGEQNRAGLVVVHGDGRVITRCVTFDDPQISGLALLQRSGLAFDVSAGPMGATICTLNGEGCPASDCWCECKGTPCAYWNYYQRDAGGGWRYASIGASARQIRSGDVDGWVWGDGSQVPPTVNLDTICGSVPPAVPEPSPEGSTEAPPTATALSSPTPTASSTPTAAATTTPSPTVSPVAATATRLPTVTPASPTPTSMASATAAPTETLTSSETPTSSEPSEDTPVSPVGPAKDGEVPRGGAPDGGLPPYAAFLLVLGVIGLIFIYLRRRRS